MGGNYSNPDTNEGVCVCVCVGGVILQSMNELALFLMERLLVAMCRYINCLTSLTLALFVERHEGHKRSTAAFLSFFLSGFFLFQASPPAERQGDRERGKGVEQN